MKNKFRAFDQKLKMFIPQSYIGINGHGDLYNNSLENCSSACEDWVLMNFFGKKDRNGVDIYEGDVIKFPNHNYFAVVIYSSDYASFLFDSKNPETINNPDASMHWGDGIEVIGNIHKNPELLKD